MRVQRERQTNVLPHPKNFTNVSRFSSLAQDVNELSCEIVLQCSRQKLRANNELMKEMMDLLQTRSQQVPGTNEDPVHGNRAPIKCRTWPCQVGTAREFIMWAALDGEE